MPCDHEPNTPEYLNERLAAVDHIGRTMAIDLCIFIVLIGLASLTAA
jgi:hypothetical protein